MLWLTGMGNGTVVLLQVWDFDVAVRAQKHPVPCNTAIFSLAHMAPETITEKHLTKVQGYVSIPPCVRQF